MDVVIVQAVQTGEIWRVFGPFRSRQRAEQVRDTCRDPYTAGYFDPDEYTIAVIPLSHYGERHVSGLRELPHVHGSAVD